MGRHMCIITHISDLLMYVTQPQALLIPSAYLAGHYIGAFWQPVPPEAHTVGEITLWPEVCLSELNIRIQWIKREY